MAIFLDCGFLMTLGCGGITFTLVSVARVGLSSLTQQNKGPEDPIEEVKESEDVSTSTSDLRPPCKQKPQGWRF
jgi:hypothetical protein